MTLAAPYIHVTDHAIERFIERFAPVQPERARGIIVSMFQTSRPWGVQPEHNSEYRIARCELADVDVVLTVVDGVMPNTRVVTTVLTEEQARRSIARHRKRRKRKKNRMKGIKP